MNIKFPLINKLRNLLEIEDEIQEPSSENILVKKGNQVHTALLFLVAAYAVAYTLVNLVQSFYIQALLNFVSFLMVVLAYYLNATGKIIASKIFNLFQLIVLIGAMFYFSSSTYGSHSGDSILVFFIPIIVGTLIVFQGPERKYGRYLAVFTLMVLAFLMSFDFHYSEEAPTEIQEGVSLELVLNIVGAALGTFLEVSFILSLSNKLNEKLHKANRELDNFVYSVSHDLRSPLTSVKGILMHAQERKEYDQTMEVYLNLAVKQLDNLDVIIKEILEYSRNSRADVENKTFDLRDVIEQIFTDLRFVPGPNFIFQSDFVNEFLITTDKSRFSTVVRNVITNAVKYRRKDHPAPYVKVLFERVAGTVKISIQDNGEGVERDAQMKIFDMFYRNSNSAEGSGLGLYICKETMRKLGGSIRMESVKGEGSTFIIELLA